MELTGEGDPLGFDEEVSRDCIFGPHFTVSATRSVGASQDPVTLRNDASAASLLQSPSTGGVLTPSRQSSSSPPPTAVQQALRVGMRVEARYGVGEDWYDATIVEVQHKPGGNVSYDETTYSLRYDDGDEEQDVSRLKIRLKGEKQRGKLEVGERVDALCARLDSSYVPGVVRRVLGDNSTSNARRKYLVHFDQVELTGEGDPLGFDEEVSRDCIFGPHFTVSATRSVGASQDPVTLRNDASAASLLQSPSTGGVLTPSRQSSSSPPPTAVQQALRVGMRVEARYGVGEDWYDATIVEVQHKPGGNVSYDETTYSLRYDDGDEEQDVSRLKIRLKGEKQRGKLEVGERVDALCVRLDSSYVPGVVRRVLGDNSTSNARRKYLVHFDQVELTGEGDPLGFDEEVSRDYIFGPHFTVSATRSVGASQDPVTLRNDASAASLLQSPSTEGVLTPSRLSSSSPPPTAVQQALRVGMRVEARYGVGEDWYDATIVEVQHKPGGNVSYDETTYSLRYDDGDEEQDVSRLKIRLKGEKQRGKLEVGERVDALCVRLDSSYVPGVVRRVLGDNSTSNARRKYLVHFDQVELMGEGDPLGFDEEVSRDCIFGPHFTVSATRSVGASQDPVTLRNDASATSLLQSPSTEGVLTPSRLSSSSPPPTAVQQALRVGMRVEARYGVGEDWYDATIVEVQHKPGGNVSYDETTYSLRYDDGDEEQDVSRLKIRLKGEKQRGKLEVGERVDALCVRLDSSYVPGVVRRVLGDNSTSNARRKYLVHFDQVELMGEGDPLGFDEEVSRDCIFGPHFTVSATRSVGASQDPVTLRNDASATSLLQSPSTEGVLTPSRLSSSSPPPTAVQQALRVGMRVEARYGVGEDWYDATIVEVQHKPGGNVSYDETTYSLRYDDGDEEQDVSRLKIRLKGEKQRGKLEVGERVDALCVRLDSSYVPGVVRRVLGDNSTSNARRKYLVHFDQVELMGEGDPLGFDEEVSRDCIFGPHFTVSATRSVGASQDPVTLRNDASATSLLQSPSTEGVLTPSRLSSSSPPPTAVQQAL